MTSPVLSIDPDSSVLQAVQVMLQRHISGLPVLDREGRLVGMITEGDFLRRAEPERSAADRAGWNTWSDPVGLRMNTPVRTGARFTR